MAEEAAEVRSEISETREVKWKRKAPFMQDYIRVVQHEPGGRWSLMALNPTVTPDDLREIADEMDRVGR